YKGRLYSMWMTHSSDEHGPGQTLRLRYSDDYGITWSAINYLFDPMDDINIKTVDRAGRFIMPIGFAELSDGLYAVGEVMDHPQLEIAPLGAIVRKINIDGTLGEAFWGWTYLEDGVAPDPVDGYLAYP